MQPKGLVSKVFKYLMHLNIKKKTLQSKNELKTYTFLQRTDIHGQEAYEMTLNITNYWRNPNQNCSELPPHTCQNGHHQKICKQ